MCVKTLTERRLLNDLYTYYREIMFIQKGTFIFIFQGSCSLPQVIGLFMAMETKIKITFPWTAFAIVAVGMLLLYLD